MNYPTDMHGPSADARTTTGKVAHCVVCNTQWQVQSPHGADTKYCPFCQAGSNAIAIEREDLA